MVQLVHMPVVSAMLRDTRGDELPPADEALMFSIYYAAVASLDQDAVSEDTNSLYIFNYSSTLTLVRLSRASELPKPT